MIKLPIIIAVILILLTGCNETNEIQPEPIPEFDISKNADGFYAGSGFVVVDHSQNTNTIAWDFGDGTVSQDSIFEHSYCEKGEYLLTLTTCNARSCKDLRIELIVKDSIINLLTNKESKTWFLTSWKNFDGSTVNFDTCLSCVYSQTFYANGDPPYYDGEHKWLNNGLQICNDDSIQCNGYGPEGHGWFDLELDPFNSNNGIFIGLAQKAGYTITVDENQLYLKSGITGNELYYSNQQ